MITFQKSLAIAFLLSIPAGMLAEVITVNSNGDQPAVNPAVSAVTAVATITLRSAIERANNAASVLPNSIVFTGFSGTFTPATNYQNIVRPLTIDGYTASGAIAATDIPPALPTAATLTIEITGTALLGDGLNLGTGSDGSTIRGLVINGFGSDGIEINSSNNNIFGNFIGTNINGTAVAAVKNLDDGVDIMSGATGNHIGDGTPAGRNIISGNGTGTDNHGVKISSNGNFVFGNYIGTNKFGTQAIPNADDGVRMNQASGNIIGAIAPGFGNLISGNGIVGGGVADGVEVNGGSNNQVVGNKIGTDFTGKFAIPNTDDGVTIQATGGEFPVLAINNLVKCNLIHFNTDNTINNGVTVNNANAFNNPILSNSIFFNKDKGINLQAAGNNNLAAPVLNPATYGLAACTGEPQTIFITGSLGEDTVVPAGTYRIEFFFNPFDRIVNAVPTPVSITEGDVYIGAIEVVVPATGKVKFSVRISLANKSFAPGQTVLSATATAKNAALTFGYGDTSEFSSNVAITKGSCESEISFAVFSKYCSTLAENVCLLQV